MRECRCGLNAVATTVWPNGVGYRGKDARRYKIQTCDEYKSLIFLGPDFPSLRHRCLKGSPQGSPFAFYGLLTGS